MDILFIIIYIYIFVYIVELSTEGVKSWKSFFPIKILPCVCSVVLGNMFSSKETKLTKIRIEAVINAGIMLLIFMTMFGLQMLILRMFGINIMDYIDK